MNESVPLGIAKDLLSICNDSHLILFQDETDEYICAAWDWRLQYNSKTAGKSKSGCFRTIFIIVHFSLLQ